MAFIVSPFRGLPRKQVSHTWLTVWVLHFKLQDPFVGKWYTHEWISAQGRAMYLHLPFIHIHTCPNAPYWVFLAVKAALWVCWHNIQVAALKHDSQGSATENKSLIQTKPTSCFGHFSLSMHDLPQQVKAIFHSHFKWWGKSFIKLFKNCQNGYFEAWILHLFDSYWDLWPVLQSSVFSLILFKFPC